MTLFYIQKLKTLHRCLTRSCYRIQQCLLFHYKDGVVMMTVFNASTAKKNMDSRYKTVERKAKYAVGNLVRIS